MFKKSLARLLIVAIKMIMQIIADMLNNKREVEQVTTSVRGEIFPMIESWQDEAADAFRAEVETKLIPDMEELIALLGGSCQGLENACMVMEQADREACAYADEMASTFRSIGANLR